MGFNRRKLPDSRCLYGSVAVLGCGFLEEVYQEALEYELKLRNIPFVSQPKLRLEYKGHKLDQYYRPNFICFGKIILELKSVEALTDRYKAQLLN